MPEITLTLTEEEWAALEGQARQRGQSPEDAALYAVRKEVWKPPRDRSSEAYKRRTTDRLARQVALVEHVKRQGFPKSKIERDAMAARLGISDRTLHRDLEVAAQALARDGTDGMTPVPAAPTGGRPNRTPRYQPT